MYYVFNTLNVLVSVFIVVYTTLGNRHELNEQGKDWIRMTKKEKATPNIKRKDENECKNIIKSFQNREDLLNLSAFKCKHTAIILIVLIPFYIGISWVSGFIKDWMVFVLVFASYLGVCFFIKMLLKKVIGIEQQAQKDDIIYVCTCISCIALLQIDWKLGLMVLGMAVIRYIYECSKQRKKNPFLRIFKSFWNEGQATFHAVCMMILFTMFYWVLYFINRKAPEYTCFYMLMGYFVMTVGSISYNTGLKINTNVTKKVADKVDKE